MKNKFPDISILLVILTCLVLDFNFKNWEKTDRVIEHDVHWYYAYLPSVFIYHDIKQEKSDYRFEGDYYLFWPTITEDGKKITKTTMGLSFLYAPFFFMAHGYAVLSNHLSGQISYPANGFSEPYKLFLLLSAIFYLFVGLDFLKKILKKFGFSDLHTGITILLIGLGTNLLCYSSQSAPNVHVYNFCLFSIFIFYTIRWHKSPDISNSIIAGLLFGLIVLIRPSNAVIILFFIFYNISNFTELKEKIKFLKQVLIPLVIILICSLIVWIPQLAYWKIVTGDYFFYSYTHERFFFDNPKIVEGLFSFRKGWLIYTPMMSFSLVGIFFMKNNLQKLIFPVTLFFLVNIYIIFSWWCWWYGGTFGQRPLIESYALLAIPLCSFVESISKSNLFIRIGFYALVIFFIWLNIFQTFQVQFEVLHWDGMTKELYFKQFGKLEKINDFDHYVDWPDYKAAANGVENNKEQFKITDPYPGKKVINKSKIHLKAANGKYVCADGTQNHLVIANKEIASTWETFELIQFENNEYAIKAYNDRFLCAELGSKNEITATREIVGPWETFKISVLDSNYISIIAVNGKYIGIEDIPSQDQMYASGNIAGQGNRFLLIKLDE